MIVNSSERRKRRPSLTDENATRRSPLSAHAAQRRKPSGRSDHVEAVALGRLPACVRRERPCQRVGAIFGKAGEGRLDRARGERPEGLVDLLFGGFSIPSMLTEERIAQRIKLWGTGAMIKTASPSQATKPDIVAQMAQFERLSASPGAIKALVLLNAQIDVRAILPTVQVPTLVLHRRGDIQVPIELGRDLAARIPKAKLIEYDGDDHVFWWGDTESLLGDIEEFVTGHRVGTSAELERILATVLFTDIIDSTRRAATIGDQAWRRLLDKHDELAKHMVTRHRGALVKTTGDGILATFDGPGRAVRCALAFEVGRRSDRNTAASWSSHGGD